MFSAFFGHYLLEKNVITREQFKQVLDLQNRTHFKIGTVAINEGFMTIEQVEEIHALQLTCDKMFGALAIESDYLNEEQLEHLLNWQTPQHLLLAKNLLDMGILSSDAFNDYLMAYKSDYNLSDGALDALKSGDVDTVVEAFLHFEDTELSGYYKEFVALFIKNQIRFINPHVCLDKANLIKKNSYEHMIRQSFYSDSNFFTAIAGDTLSLNAFASMSANEKFKVFGEYSIDAIGEYMNQNNGLFVTKMSDQGFNIRMDRHSHVKAPILRPIRQLYDLPLHCSCGMIHLILGQL